MPGCCPDQALHDKGAGLENSAEHKVLLEFELKFRVGGFDAIEHRLRGLGCEPSPPDAEENFVFDDECGSLRARGILLRLRRNSAGLLLTVKSAVPHPLIKVRSEHETLLRCDLDEGARILAMLGYLPVYSYEKTRSACSLGGAAICLDSLHFGCFVEIEAPSEKSLMEAARQLGLDPASGTRLSYADLERDPDADV
jgi:adenylate cyclase class 2